jgi:hypothetical protein
VLGPPPVDLQPLERQAQRFAGQHARRPALVVADLGEQVQGPQAGGLAEEARAVVQQILEALVAVPGPGGMGPVGRGGFGLQAGEALAAEGAEGVADGLRGAAQVGGDPRGALAPIAGEQDLAAAQGEGVGGVQPPAEGLTLGVGQRPDKKRWFHTSL